MNPELIKAARLACQRTVCYRLPSTWGFQIRIAMPGFLSFCNVGSRTQAQILMFIQQAVYQLSYLPRTFILFLFHLASKVMGFIIAFHYYVFSVPSHSHPYASLTSPFLCFNTLLSLLKTSSCPFLDPFLLS